MQQVIKQMETPEEQWEGAIKMYMALLGLGAAGHQSIAPIKMLSLFEFLTFLVLQL